MSVYEHKYPIHRDITEKDWTIDEVVKDSWRAIYDFKKLATLAEKIKAK